MAASGARTRRARPVAATVVAVAAAAAIVLAGCSGSGDGSPDASPGPPAATTPPAVNEVGTDGDIEFPSDPQEYAEAAVAAWAAPDLIRLSELATPTVQDQIIELPGPPDLAWSFIECDDSAGSSACSFHNADGDYLVLEVDHRLLAGPQAVVDATFEATSYPDEVEDYVAAFVEAWRNGNPARMEYLAVPDAVAALRQLPPGPVVGYTVGTPGDRLTPVVVELAGAELEAQVSAALLGEPQAIRVAEIQQR